MFLYHASIFIALNHLVLGLIVFALKGVNQLVNKLLSLQLFLLFIIHVIGLYTYWPNQKLKYFLGFDYVAGFAYAVVAYLYIRSMLGKRTEVNWHLFKHLIVTFIILIIFIAIHFMPNTLDRLVIECQNFSGIFFRFIDFAMYIHMVVYAVIILQMYRSARRNTKKTKNELIRIKAAGRYFLLITIMSFTMAILGLIGNGLYTGKFQPFITMLFFFTIIYDSVRVSNNIVKFDQPTDKSELPPEMRENIIVVNEHLTKNKVYLDKNLTLDSMADQLVWTRHHLSQVINKGFGMSFFELINHHRVEESLRIFSDPKNTNLKIDAISEMAGFNSRAAFYKAFKNHTGKTPGEYRNSAFKK